MAKKVLSVGQCGPDDERLRRYLAERFAVGMERASDASSALAKLQQGSFALVVVNRKLDSDASDGLAVIRALKQDLAVGATPMMLLSNHAQYQNEAISAGAVRGFGKLEYDQPATAALLAPFLDAE